MNKRKKGEKIEKEAENYLQKKGYLTYRAGKKVLKIKNRFIIFSVDIFAVFDILACRAGEAKLIQVTADRSIKRRLKKIKSISDYLNLFSIELWIKSKGGFRVLKYEPSIGKFIEREDIKHGN